MPFTYKTVAAGSAVARDSNDATAWCGAVDAACLQLGQEGFDVISLTPVTKSVTQHGGGVEFSRSYTGFVLVTGRRPN